MNKLFILTAIMVFTSACLGEMPDNLVLVQGGIFKNTKSNYYGKGVTVSSFYIGRNDVTQGEWVAVMGSSPSKIQGRQFAGGNGELVRQYRILQ